MSTQRTQVVVIGAGQAGLAAGYHLQRRGIDHVILEAAPRVGDQWRARYDSLRLYSPARYDSLPGLRFPLPGSTYPTGREMGDYLEAYAQQFGLPVITGVPVDRLEAASDGRGYVVSAGRHRFVAGQVIVATGSFQRPRTPAFAAALDPSTRQLHAGEYRNPSQLADGPVLVVGLSHSGSDLALEASAGHRTLVAGVSHGELPVSVDSRAGRIGWRVQKFLAWNVFTLDTPIGRKMAPHIRVGGAPLLRVRTGDLRRAGVELLGVKVTGVRDGRPELADGRVLDVANVIWATGYDMDLSWIQLPIVGEGGWPRQERGVVADAPGLYFLGLLFQYSFTSMLVLGAGRDAAYVVERVAERFAAPAVAPALRSSSTVG
jgi:putative flavoprotein involved in K+ transport